MFYQIHDNALDERGRIFMPATFRRDVAPEILAGDFHITPEKDGHLIVRPRFEWEAFIARIKRAQVESRVKTDYLKALNALSQKTQLDRQNRLVLSAQMRKALGVRPDEGRVELAIVGAGDYFEIWRAENFEGEDALLEKASDLRDRIESVIDETYE